MQLVYEISNEINEKGSTNATLSQNDVEHKINLEK